MKLKELSPNAYYDMVIGKPQVLERDNDGSWLYRYNIEPQMRKDEEDAKDAQIGWQCREHRLFIEPTAEALKRIIIDSVYSVDARLDLINRHNAYTSAISDDPRITEEYRAFIQFCKEVEALIGSRTEVEASSNVPRFVTNRQFRLMLISKGVNLDLITEEIKKLPAPYQQQALVSWEYAPTFERNNPMIKELAVKFGFDEQILDEIFIEAEKL